MGRSPKSGRGSLEEHAKQLKDAVLAWMEHCEREEAHRIDPNVPPPDYLKGETPEQPWAMRMKIKCANHSKLWWDGGLADQPHILMWEWDICSEAEREYYQFQERNQQIAERARQKKG